MSVVMKKTVRGIISICCAVTLMIAVIVPSLQTRSAAYSIDDAVGSVAYNFDNDGFKTNNAVDGTKVSGGQYSVGTPSAGHNGDALCIKPNKDLYDGRTRTVAFNNGATWLTLEPGTYVIAYSYMYDFSKHTGNKYCSNYSDSWDAQLECKFVYNVPKTANMGISGFQGTAIGSPLMTFDTAKSKVWQSAITKITIPGTAPVTFGIRTGHMIADIYFDDITIAKKTSIKFEADGAFVEPLKGEPGTVATLPGAAQVVINGKQFKGWYLESSLKTPVEDGFKFPENSMDVTLYAKFEDAPQTTSLTYDFDTNNKDFKANATVGSVKVSGGAYSVVSDPTGANGKVLGINANLASHNHCDPRDILFNNGAEILKLDKGNYEISYKYYVKYAAPGAYTNNSCQTCKESCQNAYSAASSFAVKFGFVSLTGFSATANNTKAAQSGNLFAMDVVSASTATTPGWQSGKVSVTVTEDMVNNNQNAFVLSIDRVPYEVYFDDIAITVDTAQDVTVKFDTMGGSAVADITGKAGTAINVSDPTRDGYKFDGWYTSSAYTNKAEMIIPTVGKTFYAKWILNQEIFDFNNNNAGFKTGSPYSGGAFTIQNDPVSSSNRTLGVNANLAAHNHCDPRDLLFNNGTNKCSLTAGTYEINYDYYAVYQEPGVYPLGGVCEDGPTKLDLCKIQCAQANSSNYSIKFGIVNAAEYGATSPNNKKYAVTGNLFAFDVVSAASPVSGWKNATVSITVTEDMVNAGRNLLALCIDKIPYAVYFDNIKISQVEVSNVTIRFDSNGGSDCSDIVTVSNAAVTLPVPSRGGYIFAGWFLSDGVTEATGVAPAADTTYYAKWQEAGNYSFIDFESEFLSGNANMYGSGYFTKQKLSSDATHNYVLRYLNTNNSALARVHKLSTNGKFVQITPGKQYKVKFDYYVESLPSNGTFVFDFVTKIDTALAYRPNAARLANANLLSSVRVDNTSAVGRWQTVEAYVTAPADVGNGDIGVYVENGKGAVVYFDNIEFSALEGNMVVLTYSIPATGDSAFIVGKTGDLIDPSKIPVLQSDKYSFGGWYTDAACTKGNEFSAKYFPAKSMTIYGKTVLSGSIHIGFKDYPWKNDTSSSKISASVMSVEQGISYDGDGYALKFDNTKDNQTTENKNILLNLDGRAFPLQDGAKYIITYRYYIYTPAPVGTIRVSFSSSHPNSMFADSAKLTDTATSGILALPKKTWISGSVAGTVKAASANSAYLKAQIGIPLNSVVYFDDFVVQQVPEGYSTVVYTSNDTIPPEPVVVKNGTTITLPSVKVSENRLFIGWYKGEDFVGTGRYTVHNDVMLNAAIVVKRMTESFENFDSGMYKIGKDGFDMDWEIYDSRAADGSAGNVKSGRYSLHRIGKDPGFKGYSVYMNNNISDQTMFFGSNYTVSMWVKIENPVHTLGAIEIGNNTTYRNSWALSNDRYAIAAIKDIADGEWHKLTYTFTAMSRYLSIYTPGNLSIFIDDVVIEYAGRNATISDPVLAYEKYVPHFLNADGEYVVEDGPKLSEFELVKRTQTVNEGGSRVEKTIVSNMTAIILIVAGSVLAAAGIAVAAVLIIKKRRIAGGKK